MQIVIELDEKFYEWLMTKDDTQEVVYKAVRKGIPLPKEHGDLIDRDELIQKQFIPNLGFDLVDLDNLKPHR